MTVVYFDDLHFVRLFEPLYFGMSKGCKGVASNICADGGIAARGAAG
jgi:hypothetical protein